MPRLLDGCNAKLHRAHEHLDGLHAAYADYLSTKPYAAIQEYDEEASEIVYIGRVVKPPPLRLGVVIGDLIHNLRSALDHLVWQLVLHNDKTPTRENKFPVCTDDKKWERVSERTLAGVNLSHVELIKEAQPFSDQDAPLARLHRLWNEDKHRVVTTVAAATRDPSDIPFGIRPMPLDKFKPVKDIGEMLSAQGFYGTPLHGYPLARLEIVATGPEPQAEMLSQWIGGLVFEDGEPVETSINRMATAVQGIVNRFGLVLASS